VNGGIGPEHGLQAPFEGDNQFPGKSAVHGGPTLLGDEFVEVPGSGRGFIGVGCAKGKIEAHIGKLNAYGQILIFFTGWREAVSPQQQAISPIALAG
jgi:hypothetical protein